MKFRLILAAFSCLYIMACNNNAASRQSSGDTVSAPADTGTQPVASADNGPAFKKEGVLFFIGKEKGDTVKTIDIEIAETDDERGKGLMYRKSMADTQGMLFMFDAPEEQSFWMKNTYISLDIIYVNGKKEIVSVQKYATPLSEESLPSFKPAQYVVEVNAGFCDKYKIKYGDKIVFAKQ